MRINLFFFYWILSFRAARCFCFNKVPSRFFLFIVLRFSLFFLLIFGTFQKRHFFWMFFARVLLCTGVQLQWGVLTRGVGGVGKRPATAHARHRPAWSQHYFSCYTLGSLMVYGIYPTVLCHSL